MGLTINRISLRNFRNYDLLVLKDIGLLTVFVGPNAVGKTNIIEAIQLVTSLNSFRNAPISQLVTWGEASFNIEARETDGQREIDVCLLCEEGRRSYSSNGKPKKAAELRGLLPAVLFTPDDLDLIKGPQSTKRSAIDAIGVQLHANYHTVKKDYEKLIRHKNLLLKEEPEPLLLQSIDELLVIIGSQFQCYRNALFRRMAPLIQEHYLEISQKKEDLSCSYTPFWEEYDPECCKLSIFEREESQKNFKTLLEKREEDEKTRKISIVGPHADKLDFFINGKNANLYGSQGQQRSLVLAFKLAEVALFQEISHTQPILLLDDVMSELDGKRREALLELLAKDIQTFITTTTLDYFPKNILEKAKIVRLPLEGGGGVGAAPEKTRPSDEGQGSR